MKGPTTRKLQVQKRPADISDVDVASEEISSKRTRRNKDLTSTLPVVSNTTTKHGRNQQLNVTEKNATTTTYNSTALTILRDDTLIPTSRTEQPGTLYTFGTNICGQLGFEAAKRKFPALVTLLHEKNIKIRDVVGGGMHTVALTNEGEVYTFGSNDEGALGRITSDAEDEESECTTPKKVKLMSRAVQIVAGDCHTAVLLDDGSVYIWGTFRGDNGIFGLIPSQPKKIHVDPLKLDVQFKVKELASGNSHIVLLTEDLRVFTFGSDIDVLGRVPKGYRLRGTSMTETDFLLSPQEILSRVGVKFSKIWAGSKSTFCKEKGKGGHVWVFGMNSMKQLGVKSSDKMISLPLRSTYIRKENFAEIAVGEYHCLALNTAGKVYSWGKPDDGQLGLGESTPKDPIWIPTPVPFFAEKMIVQVECGNSSSFALSEDMTLYAWGSGVNYQLGYGDEDDQMSPIEVLARKDGDPAGNIHRVSGGGQHVCIIADYGLGTVMDTGE